MFILILPHTGHRTGRPNTAPITCGACPVRIRDVCICTSQARMQTATQRRTLLSGKNFTSLHIWLCADKRYDLRTDLILGHPVDMTRCRKHHLQEQAAPYDPYSHKQAALGRPPLPSHGSSPHVSSPHVSSSHGSSSHGSSSSLTPRPKPATVASYHSAASSLSDWPAPGGDRSSHDDKEEEGSALPATASWAKLGSNPSTPTLHSSIARKPEGPPPLRSKGSTTSIITGVVVNNGKRKELNYAKDGSLVDCKWWFVNAFSARRNVFF